MKKTTKIIILSTFLLLSISCNKIPNPAEDNYNNNYDVSPQAPIVKKECKPYEEEIIEKMSIKEKIGQLVIVGIAADAADEEIKNLIFEEKIGGFILFKRNFDSFEDLYALNSKLKKWNENDELPLFITVDEEGGSVSRLPKRGIRIPDAAIFGDINDTNLTEKSGMIIGRKLKAAGINIDFAPVLDILTDKNNKLLSLRSYGNNPNLVSTHGLAFISGLKSQNIISVGKHFPGHGDTGNDSHVTLPIIDVDYLLLKNRELLPFENAINTGIDALMVGHLAFPKIDNSGKPASKSEIIINNLLRKELGFEGIIITDDIEMQGFLAKNDSLEESIVESFNAGADLFIIGHTKGVQIKALNALMNGYEQGFISEERINISLKRIIAIKHKYKLTNEMEFSLEDAIKLYDKEEDLEFLEELKNKKTG